MLYILNQSLNKTGEMSVANLLRQNSLQIY